MRCPVGGPGGEAPWSKTNVGFFHQLKLPLLGAIFICFHYFNRQKLTFLLPLRRFNHFYQRVQKNNLVVTSHMWHTAHIFSRKKKIWSTSFKVYSKCRIEREYWFQTGFHLLLILPVTKKYRCYLAISTTWNLYRLWPWEIIWRDVRLLIKITVNCRIVLKCKWLRER